MPLIGVREPKIPLLVGILSTARETEQGAADN
jgi:hypothetical protein